MRPLPETKASWPPAVGPCAGAMEESFGPGCVAAA